MKRCAIWLLLLVACSEHTDDTHERGVLTKLIETADPRLAIQPKGRAEPVISADACDGLELQLDANAQTIRTGTPARRVERRHEGPLDPAWLERELRTAKPTECSTIPVVVAAAATRITYETMIAAMDVCIKVGLSDVQVQQP